MLFLFLDTETTSLNFQNGQIIELAATLCELGVENYQIFGNQTKPKNLNILKKLELNSKNENPNQSQNQDGNQIKTELENNPKFKLKNSEKCKIKKQKILNFREISRFETLVRLRQEIDAKTVRITGIDKEILKNAPKLEIAQENWQNWLKSELKNQELANLETKNLEIAIIGHSLDFDLGFLRHENWFLPEFVKIDTLELAKIFLPEIEAVNLEFLTKKLNLTPKNKPSKLNSEKVVEKVVVSWETENSHKIRENANNLGNFEANLEVNLELTKKNNLVKIGEKKLESQQNLEIESQNRNLENNFENLEKYENGKINFWENSIQKNPSQSFHRALFDAQCCQNLLEFLLLKISQKVPIQIQKLWENKLSAFLPREILTTLSENTEYFSDLENDYETENKFKIKENLEKLENQKTLLEKLNQNWNLEARFLEVDKNPQKVEKPEIFDDLELEKLAQFNQKTVQGLRNLAKVEMKIDENSTKNCENFLENERESQEIIVDFDGKIVQSLNDKIAIWSQKVSLEKLSKMLIQNLPRDLNLLLLQLIWIALEYQKISKKSQNWQKNFENKKINSNFDSKILILKLHTQREYLIITELWLE